MGSFVGPLFEEAKQFETFLCRSSSTAMQHSCKLTTNWSSLFSGRPMLETGASGDSHFLIGY
jgi:hypothetical protein